MKRTVSAALVLTLALALLLPGLLQAGATQVTPAKAAPKVKTPPPPVTVHPAFASLKDKTAVLVFLAWLWLFVAVLAYFLRLKIREADRVYGLKLYPAAKDAPRPPTQ